MKLKKIIKHLLKFFDKKAKKQRKEQSAPPCINFCKNS